MFAYAASPVTKISLPGASGSGPYAVISKWATAFTALYPEADITFDSIGSGSTQKALWGDIDCENKPVTSICSDSNDSLSLKETLWGIGDAPISPQYYQDHPTLQLQQFPACAGAVLIVHSKEVLPSTEQGSLNLTLEAVAGIFNATIEYWDDPILQAANPTAAAQLPHEPINVLVRSDGSGQTNILTESLGYHVPTWPEEAVGKLPEWPTSLEIGTLDDYSREQQTCRQLLTEQQQQQQQQQQHTNTVSRRNTRERDLGTTFHVIPWDMNSTEPTEEDQQEDQQLTVPPTSQPPRYFEADGKKQIAMGLMKIPNSIGYMELGYYRELQDFLAQSHLGVGTSNNTNATTTYYYSQATTQSIRATMDEMAHQLDPITLDVELSHSNCNYTNNNTQDGGGGYPTAGYAYWYIKQNHTAYDSCYQAWLLCQFVTWAYTSPLAAELAEGNGWITPPPSVVQQALERLQAVQCQTQDGKIVSALLDYTPEPYVINYNTIERIRPAAFVLAAVVLLTSIFFAGWIYAKRKARIVKASQPVFLYLICLGTFIMGLAIIPLGIDDSLASLEACHVACMSWMWYLPIGFTLAFSALFSKVHRLNLLVKSAAQFRRLKVEATDVMVPLGVMMTANVTLLIIWTIVDPLKWKRIMESPYESVGRCASDGDAWIVFATLIGLVNFGALLLANVEAYKARAISDEFAETKYIAISVMSMLQALLLGLPLSIMVHTNPPARLFTFSGIIFVTTMSLLLLMFVPKMYYVKLHKKRMKDMSESHRQSTNGEGILILQQQNQFNTSTTAPNTMGRSMSRDRYTNSMGDGSSIADSIRASTTVLQFNSSAPVSQLSQSLHDSFPHSRRAPRVSFGSSINTTNSLHNSFPSPPQPPAAASGGVLAICEACGMSSRPTSPINTTGKTTTRVQFLDETDNSLIPPMSRASYPTKQAKKQNRYPPRRCQSDDGGHCNRRRGNKFLRRISEQPQKPERHSKSLEFSCETASETTDPRSSEFSLVLQNSSSNNHNNASSSNHHAAFHASLPDLETPPPLPPAPLGDVKEEDNENDASVSLGSFADLTTTTSS